ncbi:MAG: NAD(P)/FAD-dependent oxidoreductase [Bacteroidota bacterium]
MPDVAVTIVGGGVVGLAVAAELAPARGPLVLLERNPKYGQETSSRNSEVIHAGIYYLNGSLKAEMCVEGNRRLYELCAANDIPHKRITKIITATVPEELESIETLYKKGTANGVVLEHMTAEQVRVLEPRIMSVGGLYSPNTGIISAHGLMDYFARKVLSYGGTLQTRCELTGIERTTDGYRLTIREPAGITSFTTEVVVNAAGLEADTVAAMAGIDIDAAGYRLHWSKGNYFAAPGSLRGTVNRLVYPVPTHTSLGVHVVLDLGGRLRFGPDVEYLKDRVADYSVDESRRDRFAESARRLLPFLSNEDLTPDMSGIRPKLQGPGDPFRDFVICEESSRGLPGFVNLIGIESPGLTASPAIARKVAALLSD